MYAIVSKPKYESGFVSTYAEFISANAEKVVVYADYNKAIKKVREMKKKDTKNSYIIRKV